MFIGNNDFKTIEELSHFTALLNLAEAIATVAHEGQVDKAGVGYIHHPETVSAFCMTTYGKIVGWLHDVVEDTNVSLDDLRHLGFDEFLVEAVRCVTKEEGYVEDEYYHRIKYNPIAKEVKLADLKHNTDLSRIPADADEKLKSRMIKKNAKYRLYEAYLRDTEYEYFSEFRKSVD